VENLVVPKPSNHSNAVEHISVKYYALWMVLYKLYVFCSDMKFKMAATAGLSFTLDPMGKMFQNASSLKRTKNVQFVEDHPMNIHVQFGFNNICSF
jgi:hypothetical protein